MFSRMSSSRKADLLEGNDPILFDGPPQTVLADRLGDNVDRAFKNRFKPPIDGVKPLEIGKSAGRGLVGKPHHDVDIGFVSLLAAGGGTEQRKASHAGLSELGLVGL